MRCPKCKMEMNACGKMLGNASWYYCINNKCLFWGIERIYFKGEMEESEKEKVKT